MSGIERPDPELLAQSLVTAAFQMAHQEYLTSLNLGLVKPLDADRRDGIDRKAICINATYWWTEMLDSIEKAKGRIEEIRSPIKT